MNLEPAPRVLIDEIKTMLVETLLLQTSASELVDNQQLFGPGGLGLDSVDALQLVVALDKNYGLKISDAEVAKTALMSVSSIAIAVVQHRGKASSGSASPPETEG